MKKLRGPGLLGIILLSGCPRKDPDPGTMAPPTVSATAITTAATARPTASDPLAVSPTASSSAAPVDGPAPTCKVLSQKSWGKGANKETGLTAAELPDGRVAIGAAIGLTPHVLVVARGGEGKLMKVPVKEGTDFAKAPAASEGTRHVMRVTPVKLTGDKVEAFVDYHDDYKNKRRRVACGAAGSADTWVSFDGVPLLEQDPKPTGDALAALFKKKEKDGEDAYHELRDCRTFSDLKGDEIWVVGSDLLGHRQGDEITWKASLIVDRGMGVHEHHLHETDIKDLKGDPPRVPRFEVPVSRKIHGGDILLATRFGGSLLVGLLGPDKTLKGEFKTYPGYPTIPDMTSDGTDTILVTSFAKANVKNEYLLWGLRLSAAKPELPKTLSPVNLVPDGKDSETDPDFTIDSKGRRWLSYVDGARGHGKLFIAPLDASFNAVGKPYEITQDKETASEARLVATSGGTILVAYLRESDSGVEIITEDLECDIVK